MRGTRISVFLAIAVFLAGTPLVAQKNEVRSAIESANKEFVAAFARGDAAMIANLYTRDAQALPPGREIVTGREELHSFWQSVLQSGVKSASLTTVDVQQAGDIAFEVGTYEMKGGDGKVLDRGKYLVVWKRENTEWKLYRDIWNSSEVAPIK